MYSVVNNQEQDGTGCIQLLMEYIQFHLTPDTKRFITLAQNVPKPMYGYELLMMCGKAARNMYSRNTNKTGIQ